MIMVCHGMWRSQRVVCAIVLSIASAAAMHCVMVDEVACRIDLPRHLSVRPQFFFFFLALMADSGL